MSTLSLTLQTDALPAGKYLAKLNRASADASGIKLVEETKAPISNGIASLSWDLAFVNGVLSDLDELQIDIYKDDGKKSPPLLSTGPLIEVARQIEALGEAEVIKREKLSRVITLSRTSVRVSGEDPTIFEQLDKAFQDPSLAPLLKDRKAAPIAIRRILAERDSFTFLCNKLRKILLENAATGEFNTIAARRKVSWFSRRYVRRYLVGKMFEIESKKGDASVWFAVLDGRELPVDESLLSITPDQSFVNVEQAVGNREIPVLDIRRKTQEVIDAVADSVNVLLQTKFKQDNSLQRALDFIKPAFASSGYDFTQASDYIRKFILQRRRWNPDDVRTIQRSVIDGITDFVSLKEAERLKARKPGLIAAGHPMPKESVVSAAVKRGLRKLVRGKKVPRPNAALQTPIAEHKQHVRKAAHFIQELNQQLTELYGVATCLSNNFLLLDQVTALIPKGAIGKTKLSKLEDLADVTETEWKAWLAQPAQAGLVSDHVFVKNKHQLTPALNKKLEANYAFSIYDLLGKLYANRRFTSTVDVSKLPGVVSKSWPAVKFFFNSYSRNVSIVSCSPKAWARLLESLTEAERKKVAAVAPEARGWQLAHAILPDPYDHDKSIKIYEAIAVAQKAAKMQPSGRNVIKEMMRVGKVNFLFAWQAVNIPDIQKATIEDKARNAAEGEAIFKRAKRQIYYKFMYSNGQATSSLTPPPDGVNDLTPYPGATNSALLGLSMRSFSQVNWDTLFSGKDYCACDHEESLISPSAYVVDLLNWLKTIPGQGSGGMRPSTAYEILLAQRPDLEHLALSKQNTLVTLPYIDIINELLERHVYQPPTGTPPLFSNPANLFNETSDGVTHIETNGTSEDRRYKSEIIHRAVWDNAYMVKLISAQGIHLPYDHWLEESREWLNAVGSSLHEIMFMDAGSFSVYGMPGGRLSAVRDFGLGSPLSGTVILAGGLSGADDGENFGLSAGEKTLLTGSSYREVLVYNDTAANLAKDIPSILAVLISKLPLSADDSDAPGILTGNVPHEEVEREYFKVFREIVDTRFVQSTATASGPVQVLFLDESCSIDKGKAEIINYQATTFENLFKFCKLLGKLKWRPWQLDWVISQSGNRIDDALISNISNALRVRDVLGVTIEEMLCICFGFYTDLYFDNTEPVPAKKHKVIFSADASWRSPLFRFLASIEGNAYPTVGTLRDYSYNLAGPAQPSFLSLNVHADGIARSLNITTVELIAITASMSIMGTTRLLAAQLQQIYMLVILSRYLKLPVETLCSLPEMRAFALTDIKSTLNWLMQYKAREKSIKNYPALVDLLDSNSAALNQTDDLVKSRTEIDSEVNNVLLQLLEYFTSVDPNPIISRNTPTANYPNEIAQRFITFMPPEGSDFSVITNAMLAASTWLLLNPAPANRVFRLTNLSFSPDAPLATPNFQDGHFLLSVSTDLKLKIVPSTTGNAITCSIGTVVNTGMIANAAGTEYELRADTAYFISIKCTGGFSFQANEVKDTSIVRFWFLDESLALTGGANLVRSSFLALFHTAPLAFIRLLRIIRYFNFDQYDLQYVSDPIARTSVTMQPVDLVQLCYKQLTGVPLASAINRIASFSRVRKMIDHTSDALGLLDGSFAYPNMDPYNVTSPVTSTTVNAGYAARLAEALQVDANVMRSILNSYRFKLQPITLNGNTEPMAVLYNWAPELLVNSVIDWVERFHSGKPSIVHLLRIREVRTAPTAPTVWSFKLAAHNRVLVAAKVLTGTAWKQKRKEIEDNLRKKRRRALLDFLTSGNPFGGFASSVAKATLASLAKELLVPIEIAPCRSTSRIREAISAIQRFVTYCKLGTIRGINLSNDNVKEWETFRREYRIWEVAKIILRSPEDYLLPRLRIDKTPIYSQAESELEQDEATLDSAEMVVRNYVKSLHDISNLEFPCVISYSPSSKEKLTIVVGRTKSNPHKYYFSSMMESDNTRDWTPWHEVPVEIEGDHVLPVIHHGYFYLFWPSIKVITDKEAAEDPVYKDKDLNPEKFEVKLNYTRLEEVLDSEFPKRIKWAKKRQSKTAVEVIVESASDLTEKLDLDQRKDRIHLLAHSDSNYNGDLKVSVAYWEALTEGVSLRWNTDALEMALSEIRSIISTQMDITFYVGTIHVNVRQTNDVPDSGVDWADQWAENVHDSLVEYFGSNTSVYWSGRRLPNAMYVNSLLAMFFSSSQMNNLESALNSGNLESTDNAMKSLATLGATFDAGLTVTVVDVSGATTTTEIAAAKNTGRSLKEIVDEARLNLDLNYENSYGAKYELHLKNTFILNACGDLHIAELDSRALQHVINHSDSHETMETSIHFQRLYQDRSDALSVYRQRGISTISQVTRDFLFHHTPSRFAIVMDPAKMPFRIGDDEQSNFVFQDANHSLLVMPTVQVGGILKNPKGFYYAPYASATLSLPLARNGTLHSFMSANYRKSELYANRSASIAKDASAVYGALGFNDKRVINTSTKEFYARTERTAVKISSQVHSKGQTTGPAIMWTNSTMIYDDVRVKIIADYAAGLIDPSPLLFAQFTSTAGYKLLPLDHPYACDYLTQVSMPKKGVELLMRKSSNQGESNLVRISLFANGNGRYDVQDESLVDYSEAEPLVYFSRNQVFWRYNHELFFHLNFRIAVNFSDNGKFEEAYNWFHNIFDPRRTDGRVSPWGFVPFKTARPTPSLEDRTRVSVADPFNPYVQAEINQQVYMKAVFYKYLDNLISWADNEFSQYTGESLDRAEILYREVLALLGRPPLEVVRDRNKSTLSYAELYASASGDEELGTLALEDVPSETESELMNESNIDEVVLAAQTPEDYFCHSSSTKLNDYFALINQRLFNLQNCRDINGNLRDIPLFQPPISPWLLVLARAGGLDLGSVLSYRAEAAGYRWEFLQQKALEYAELAARFADKLQAALEKKDSGALALLRETHQRELLKSTREIRRMNIRDAEIGLRQLERSKESIEFRLDYYAGRPRVISQEEEEVEKNKQAFIWDISAQGLETLGSVLSIIPQIGAIAGPSGGATTEFGGLNLGQMSAALASGARMGASILRHESYLAGVAGSRQRRYDDWQFQANSARKELRQVEQQLLSAQVRIDLAERELESVEQQQEQSNAILEFMDNQFTSVELYEWQVKETLKLFRLTYNMAFDMAKRAEAAYLRDTLRKDDRIIQGGNWLAERKGLGCTDKLLTQLRQLDQSYWTHINPLNQVSKRVSVSLAISFPDQLATLLTTGMCTLNIKGFIFDAHWPDHTSRRIKSVAISIPCIKGPFVPINARLELNAAGIRTVEGATTYAAGDYTATDPPFRNFAETNDANQDTGRLQFDDGSRVLNAFEGAGLDDSTWTLTLDPDCNKIDFSTISDVIITFEFTALVSQVRKNQLAAIKTAVANSITDVRQLISIRGFFAPQWDAFVSGTAGSSDVIELKSTLEMMAGIPFNTLTNDTWTAYYILSRGPKNQSTIASYGISNADYIDATVGDISIKKIWDQHPGATNAVAGETLDDATLRGRLNDIILYFKATKT